MYLLGQLRLTIRRGGLHRRPPAVAFRYTLAENARAGLSVSD
jgi:hypothetical protein